MVNLWTYLFDTEPKESQIERVLYKAERLSSPEKSKTFRKGGSGEWREYLGLDVIRELQTVALPALKAFGYEAE